MRTIPRHRGGEARGPTTELEAARLRALVRETKKRPTTNLEVEMIRVETSGSIHISFDDECLAAGRERDAITQLDSGDPLPAGSRTKIDREAFEPLDDDDPIPAGSRTRIDRDAIEPLPRPDGTVYPTHGGPRISPALIVGLAVGVAAYVGFWLIA
jgi:hypothetical protein